MESDKLLYPAPQPELHYLDIDEYLIYGSKKRKSKKPKKRKPMRQLEFDFNVNINT